VDGTKKAHSGLSAANEAQTEQLKSAAARISLRINSASSIRHLPTVFNAHSVCQHAWQMMLAKTENWQLYVPAKQGAAEIARDFVPTLQKRER
jgi:hypothetical protein